MSDTISHSLAVNLFKTVAELVLSKKDPSVLGSPARNRIHMYPGIAP